MNDPNEIYAFATLSATGRNDRIGQVFADARDNPKYSKTVLMACVLACWMACAEFINAKASIGLNSNPDDKAG